MRILAIKTLTPEALRDAVKSAMEETRTTRNACAHCAGKGFIEKTAPMSQAEVADSTGLTYGAVNAFLKGKDLSLSNGMKVMAWLEKRERLGETGVSNGDAARSMTAREGDREAQRHAANLAAQAAASAGVDAINRPLQLKGPKQLVDGRHV